MRFKLLLRHKKSTILGKVTSKILLSLLENLKEIRQECHLLLNTGLKLLIHNQVLLLESIKLAFNSKKIIKKCSIFFFSTFNTKTNRKEYHKIKMRSRIFN